MVKNKMKVIDLFCGAGGFSKGFEQAGFEIVLGIDNWDVACKNFKLNHPNSDVWNKNVAEIVPEELPEADIIIGGTPCQEFTSLNLKRQPWRGMINVCHFLRISEKLKPKSWIMENVVGLKRYLPEYLHKATLKASDFGCESGRKRLFVGKFITPRPNNINTKPKRTLVGIDNRNKGHRNMMVETKDLDSLKFEGSDKEIRQLKANCVIPKLAYNLAKSIRNKNGHIK